MRSGKHSNEDLQKDFNDYGEDFSLYILDEANTYEDRTKEYEWMFKLGTCDRRIGYNYKEKEKAISKLGMEIPLKEGVPTPLHFDDEDDSEESEQ